MLLFKWKHNWKTLTANVLYYIGPNPKAMNKRINSLAYHKQLVHNKDNNSKCFVYLKQDKTKTLTANVLLHYYIITLGQSQKP